ncbi:MAG TPA: hypothetical protein VIL40_01375 [Thermaerobacter sp.]
MAGRGRVVAREGRRDPFRLVLADGRTVTVFRDRVDGRWYAVHDR